MSKRAASVPAEECTSLGATRPELESYPNRELTLGPLAISRALPVKDRRLVGPWCFLDRFGPLTFDEGKPMDVAPHPHIGPSVEHALLVLSGDAALDGEPLQDRVLYYIGSARSEANVSSRNGTRLLLIGGPPFPEKILMWWNFVARSAEEIAQARADWEDGERFGEVTAYKGPRLNAPSLVHFARPNPVS